MQMVARKSREELKAECRAFNEKFPLGSKVTVRLNNGQEVCDTIRSTAQFLYGLPAFVWLWENGNMPLDPSDELCHNRVQPAVTLITPA